MNATPTSRSAAPTRASSRIAERLDVRRIATLDDHFWVVRPAHCDAFALLPSEVTPVEAEIPALEESFARFVVVLAERAWVGDAWRRRR